MSNSANFCFRKKKLMKFGLKRCHSCDAFVFRRCAFCFIKCFTQLNSIVNVYSLLTWLLLMITISIRLVASFIKYCNWPMFSNCKHLHMSLSTSVGFYCVCGIVLLAISNRWKVVSWSLHWLCCLVGGFYLVFAYDWWHHKSTKYYTLLS